MKILALIPARMGSSRFPGKPMKLINGKQMIKVVYENVKKNELLDDVYVATCDEEIKNLIEKTGGQSVMTSKKHERASDRCAEALQIIESKKNIKYDIVVMVQGDEPMVNSEMISEALGPMIKNQGINVVNLLGKIKSEKEYLDPNCIKVVCDLNNDAIYFSRYPIPYNGAFTKEGIGKQICIIPFKRDFLLKYVKLKMTPLEILESIDMLRVIENGHKVKMVDTDHDSYAVDTEQDLIKVEKILNL